MTDIFLDARTAPLEDMLESLSRNGVVVVRNYLDPSQLPVAREEFFRLMDAEKNSALFLSKNKSRVARFMTKLPAKWEILAGPLYSSQTRQIADAFYGANQYRLNENVYLTHDVDSMDFNGGWHTDPSRSLKFMLYLNDVSAASGAMKYIPGSNYHGIYRIQYNRMRGQDDFPVFLPENEVPRGEVSLEGSAGTMLIFDAAGIHSAGRMNSGTERLVIRGHCHVVPTLRSRISDRIRKSALNPLRYMVMEDEMVADRFKSKPAAEVIRK